MQTTNTISQDLWEKSLPDGKTAHAIAGYLYFLKPPHKAKDTAWELRYENVDSNCSDSSIFPPSAVSNKQAPQARLSVKPRSKAPALRHFRLMQFGQSNRRDAIGLEEV